MSQPNVARPLPARTCPLCGAPNDCAPAASGCFETDCWCRRADFPPELRARVPEAERGVACICAACAARGKAECATTNGDR